MSMSGSVTSPVRKRFLVTRKFEGLESSLRRTGGLSWGLSEPATVRWELQFSGQDCRLRLRELPAGRGIAEGWFMAGTCLPSRTCEAELVVSGPRVLGPWISEARRLRSREDRRTSTDLAELLSSVRRVEFRDVDVGWLFVVLFFGFVLLLSKFGSGLF